MYNLLIISHFGGTNIIFADSFIFHTFTPSFEYNMYTSFFPMYEYQSNIEREYKKYKRTILDILDSERERERQ